MIAVAQATTRSMIKATPDAEATTTLISRGVVAPRLESWTGSSVFSSLVMGMGTLELTPVIAMMLLLLPASGGAVGGVGSRVVNVGATCVVEQE